MPEPSKQDRTGGRLRAVASVALVLAVAAWAGWILWDRRASLVAYDWSFGPGWLLGSFGLLLAMLLACSEMSRLTLRAVGAEIKTATMFRIFTIAQVTRYVPGGVWHFLGRIYLTRRANVTAPAIGASLVVEQILAILAGVIAFVLALPWLAPGAAGHVALVLAAAPLLALLVHPRVLNLALGAGWRIAGKKPPPPVSLTFGDLLRLLGIAVAIRAGLGASFVMLVRGVLDISWSSAPALVGADGLAFAVGMLAPFSPGGAGAREAALVLVLQARLPVEAAAALAILSRLQWVLAELAALGLSFFAGAKREQDG